MKKAIILFFVLFSTITFSANYYVSNAGDDLADGLTTSTSWKTITKVNSSTFAANDFILFKCGDVFTGTLRIRRNNLSIGSYGTGNKPKLTALTSVTSWTNLTGGIYESNVLTAKNDVDIVTIDGQQMAAGRFPNTGYLTYQTFTSTSLTSSDLSGNPNWTDAEAVIRKVRWIMDRQKITSQAGSTINLQSTTSGYTGKAGFGFFIQKDARTLDQFGEWFYDTVTKKMKVYFGVNNPASYIVKVSTADTLINIGAFTNITIDGLQLEGAGSYGIRGFDASYINVKNCIVNNCGTFGLYFWNTPNLLIDGNSVTDILGNGIWVRNNGVSTTTVTHNNLNRVGWIAGMGPSSEPAYLGLLVNGNNTDISYNNIDSTGYISLQFQGNNVAVKNNYISNFNFIKDDGGGIYTWANNGVDTYTNREISNNILINGIGAPAGTQGGTPECEGIYLDGGTMAVNVHDNTVNNMARSALMCNNPVNVTFSNNTCYLYRYGMEFVRIFGSPVIRTVTATNNILYSANASDIGYRFMEYDVSTSGSATIQADIQAMGTVNNNYYSQTNSAPFTYVYSLIHNDSYVYPAGLNLPSWRTFSGFETNSNLISTDSNVFQYNATSSPVSFNFSGLSKNDVYGTVYNNSYTIPAYKSVILFDNGLSADIQAPSAPTGLTSPSVTQTSFTVSWTASTDNIGVTGYDIYQGGVLKGSTALTSFSLTGLSCNTAYAMTVKAKDAIGNVSASSSTLNVTTSACAALINQPLTVSSFGAEEQSNTAAMSLDNNVATRWASDGVLANGWIKYDLGSSKSITQVSLMFYAGNTRTYPIRIDVDGVTKWTGSTTTTTGFWSQTFTGLTGRYVQITMTGINSGGSSYNSLYETDIYGTDTQAPSAPTGLASSSVTQPSFTLSWTASTDNVGVTGYDVYQGGILKGSTTSTSFSVTALSCNTTYTMTVKAKDAAGNVSAASSNLNVTTLACYEMNYPLTVSSFGSEAASNTAAMSIDNNETTRWASDGVVANGWIKYDLGSSQNISKVSLKFFNGDWRTYPIKIDVDGVTKWSGSTTTTTGYWSQTFGGLTGRYVQITMTGNTNDGSGFNSIIETDIYGDGLKKGEIANSFIEGKFAGEDDGLEVIIYPNPTTSKDKLNVKLRGYQEERSVKLVMSDLSGKIMHNVEVETITEKEQVVEIGTQNIIKGMYIMSVISRNSRKNIKVIVN